MYVMLKQNWPGVFRRCVRGEQNVILDTLEFTPGEVREFEDGSLEALAIKKDIGKAILPLAPDDRRILRAAAQLPVDAAEVTPGRPPSTPTTIVPPAGDATAKKPTKSEIKQQRKAAAAAAAAKPPAAAPATAVQSPAAAAPQQPAIDPLALPPMDDAPEAPEFDE